MPRKKIPRATIDAANERNAFVPTAPVLSRRLEGQKGLSRVMYIENKSGSLSGGDARIGRFTFSKSRGTIYYQGRAFTSLKGRGFKANFIERKTGDAYWISGPKKNGEDRLYNERVPVAIDEDVREEYWTEIRGLPENAGRKST